MTPKIAVRLAAAFALSPLFVTGALGAAPVPTAVFPFDLIDDSEEGAVSGVRADQTNRLALITAELRRLLVASGRYNVLDMAALATDIANDRPIYRCNGCAEALARELGADLAMVATVQKVSNLILNINVYVRDVKADRIVKQYSVDLRGNTDESWLRGIGYLVKNQLLAEGENNR